MNELKTGIIIFLTIAIEAALCCFGFHVMMTWTLELWQIVLVGIATAWLTLMTVRNIFSFIMAIILFVYVKYKMKELGHDNYLIDDADSISDMFKLKNVVVLDDEEEFEEIEDEII